MISADLVLRHGEIMTLDAQATRAHAVAIAGGRILALDQDAEALVGKATAVIDLGGRPAIRRAGGIRRARRGHAKGRVDPGRQRLA
jgi:predicted amidohydrolase